MEARLEFLGDPARLLHVRARIGIWRQLTRAREIVEAIEVRMLAGLDDDERLKLAEVLRGCADSLPPGAAGSRAR